MQHDRSSGGVHESYPSYARLEDGHSWRARSSSPFTLFTNLKKYLLRRQIVSNNLELPPSFNRHTRPLTTSTESSPFEVIRFCFLCSIWYTTSALSSNTGKTILVGFSYPVTLTIVQFAMVAGYCLFLMTPAVGFSRMRPPTRGILMTTLPMGAFQVGGHMFSSMAISRIPVSTVHTIKVGTPVSVVDAF